MTDEIGSESFTPQNELEVELVRAAHEPAFRDAFLRELVKAEVYLALLPANGRITVGADGQAVVPPDVRLDLEPIVRDGKTLFPIFSAPVRAQAAYQANHFIATDKVHNIFLRHPGTEFVLNPGSDYGVLLLRSDVEAMLRGDLTAH
ncbi:SseB family protein [Enterovirga aerilata]|uniref:SseB protein N-terminal domain-containing protein n=1 Tax=Enterovirga aerilata TaxID=2730920 RepID=A0A849IEB9_9HYPH|nr:SseB family protein [Enterovirga sp. DB1703]NNM74799.1 hypothetical protein [Enterovirga sp. DB1703]